MKIDLVDEPVTGVPRVESFEEFVVATGDRLLRTAVLLTGDRHVAEDLVQSAYAQAFARWRLVSRADNPWAYTRTILTRLFLSDRRRRRVREVGWEQGADVAATPVDPALRLSLLEALATLPAKDRALLVLPLLRGPPGRRGRRPARPHPDRLPGPRLPGARPAAPPLPRPGRPGLIREERP